MINHSPFVAPSPSLALVRREAPARAAATLCALAFADCAPLAIDAADWLEPDDETPLEPGA